MISINVPKVQELKSLTEKDHPNIDQFRDKWEAVFDASVMHPSCIGTEQRNVHYLPFLCQVPG